jgi:hypothetical protein
MENKYLNFDGMASDVPNDMPWSDTVWSNQSGNVTEEEAVRVTQLFGTALNASGEETITLDHHIGNRPNMVLSDIDNSTMPDSDVWSNHPGFIGITWSKKKAEREREAKEQAKVNAEYPNTGSCAVLTSSLERLDGDVERYEANKDGGSRGAKRVNARARKTRGIRRPSIQDAMESACVAEQQEQQVTLANQQQLFTQSAAATGGLNSPTNLMLGFLVLGAIGYGIYKVMKR